jgi:hypothetical protein
MNKKDKKTKILLRETRKRKELKKTKLQGDLEDRLYESKADQRIARKIITKRMRTTKILKRKSLS